MSEDRSGSEYLLERIESIMIGEVKLPSDVLPGEVCQWNDNVWVVEDEPAIKIILDMWLRPQKSTQRHSELSFLLTNKTGIPCGDKVG